MTIVSYDYDFLYLRTRKTGSTATELALQPYCTPEGVAVTEANGWPMITRHGVVGRRSQGAPDHKLRQAIWWNPVVRRMHNRMWFAHQPAWQVKRNLSADFWARAHKLTTLRNPFTRTVSMFYWRRRNTPELFNDRDATIRAFRRFVKNGTITEDREIVFIGEDFVPTVILRQESLTADLTAFAEKIGADVSKLHIPQMKVTRSSKPDARPTLTDLYDEETADIVRQKLDWFFTHGGYSTEVPLK